MSRSYVAITLGVPRPPEGRVATNIGRCVCPRDATAGRLLRLAGEAWWWTVLGPLHSTCGCS